MRSLVPLGMLCAASLGAVATPSATLPPGPVSCDPAVLVVQYPHDTQVGRLVVPDHGVALADVTLRAHLLTSGANTAFVRFPVNKDADVVALDVPALNCSVGAPCTVPFEVYGVHAEGTYQGNIDLYIAGHKQEAVPIDVTGLDPGFQPLVTGDVVKGDRIAFDATDDNSFTISVQNPPGSPWRRFNLRDCPSETTEECGDAPAKANATGPPAVATATETAAATVVYLPSTFMLGPGKSQVVIVHVSTERKADLSGRFLQIADADEPSLKMRMLVSLKRASPTWIRTGSLLFFVILGAAVSVVLNNVFPMSRMKSDVLNALQRVSDVLGSAASLGAALKDALYSEVSRNRLLARAVRFYNLSKDSILQDVQQATTELATLVNTARSISILRSQLESGTLPVRALLAIERALCEAEDNLLAFDAVAAGTRLMDATRIRTAADDPTVLRQDLTSDIRKLLVERGNPAGAKAVAAIAAAPAAAPVPAEEPQAAPASPRPESRTDEAIAHSQELAISAGRAALIAELIAQLERDVDRVCEMRIDELLEVEQDFYVADRWTELVEPVVMRNKARLEASAHDLLECLVRNPTSRHAQLRLELMHGGLIPADIQRAIDAETCYIDCNPRPRFYELIDCQFVFGDPCIGAVRAARHIVSYVWDFGDGTQPQEDFERVKHYYVRPARGWRGGSLPSTRKVSVLVSIPGVTAKPVNIAQDLTLLDPRNRVSEVGIMQIVNFLLSTTIAVMTAFAAQYGSTLPGSLQWQVLVSAFMFGFGIDQIRDKTSAAPTATRGVALVAGVSPAQATPVPAAGTGGVVQPPGKA